MKSSAVGDELAVDGLDAGKQAVHRRADLGVLHLGLEFLGGFIERRQIAIALDRSVSTRARRRFTSLFAFSNSTAGTLLSPVSFSRRLQIVFRDFERFGGGQGQSRAVRRLKIGARLLQLPRGRFIGDRRQQLAFLDFLPDGAASGGKRSAS